MKIAIWGILLITSTCLATEDKSGFCYMVYSDDPGNEYSYSGGLFSMKSSCEMTLKEDESIHKDQNFRFGNCYPCKESDL